MRTWLLSARALRLPAAGEKSTQLGVPLDVWGNAQLGVARKAFVAVVANLQC